MDISSVASPAIGSLLGVNSFAFIGTGMAGSWAPSLPSGSAPAGAELASSPVDWSTYLLGWDFNIDNSLAEDIGHCGSTTYLANCMPLVDRKMRLSLLLRLDDTVASLANLLDPSAPTNYDGSTNYPSLVLYNWGRLALDTSGTVYYLSLSLVFPRLTLDGKPQLVDQDGIMAVRANYMVAKDPSYSPLYAYVWNKDDTALAA